MEPNASCGAGAAGAGSGAPHAARLPAVAPGDRVTVTYECGARLTSTVVRDGARLVLDIPGGHFVVRDANGVLAPDIVQLDIVQLDKVAPA